MNKLSIIGYSGHSFECIETANDIGYNIIGYFDSYEKHFNPLSLKYLGKESYEKCKSKKVFICIGNNEIRKNIYIKYIDKSIFVNLINPYCKISKYTHISNQVFVNKGAIINSFCEINEGCIVNTGAIIEHECIIGKFSHIGPGSVILGNVSIGENCFIGANSTILPGVNIGDNVTIGAGSVVLKNVPENSTLVGNPGQIIKKKL